MAIYTYTLLMHEYWFKKEEILELTSSQVWALIEMVAYIKNPELLKKQKDLRFSSEFEFEQYLLKQMKLK